MIPAEITGKLVIECLIELKITVIRKKLKEVSDEIDEIDKMLNSSTAIKKGVVT